MNSSGNRFFVNRSTDEGDYPRSPDPMGERVLQIVLDTALLVLIASCFLVLVSPVTALDWATETVDRADDTGWYTSLALDTAGTPHISYVDWTTHHLKYAAKTEGIWYDETVDTADASGEYSSIKADTAGRILISYYDGNRGNLSFAIKTGDNWNIVTVDSGGVGRHTSLALDNRSNPRISYQDLLNMKLKYAQRTGDVWTVETVDNSVNVGTYTSLALDQANNPHISYYDAGHGFLKYATKSGDTWTIVTVDNSGNAGYYTSLKLNSTGYPRISYYDGVNKDLKFATKTGSSWVKEIVDREGNVGLYTSLALDSSQNPHISYYDSTSGHLKYATKAGDVWTNETVDTALNTGLYSSLALDSTDNPRISYRTGGTGDLKYATAVSPMLLNFTATPRYGTAPLTVLFTDTSLGGSPTLWNWSFGDGMGYNTSTNALRSPEHVYKTPGVYTVNLTIRNLIGASTLSRSGYITVIAPVIPTQPTTSPEPTATSSPVPTLTTDPTLSPDPTLLPDPTVSPTPTPTPTSSPVTTLTPSPTLSQGPTLTCTPTPVSSPSGDIEGSDDVLPVLSSTTITRETGFFGCQTVNVGGDSAVSRITITGRDVSDSIITARKVSFLPTGVTPINLPVYQYIDIIPARYAVISAALIEFDVPLFAISDHHAIPDDVRLCRFNTRAWVCLPTWTTGSKNGKVLYRAESQEFSLFAIIFYRGSYPATEDEVFITLPAPENIPEHASKKPFIAVKPGTPEGPVPVTSDTSLSSMTFVFPAIVITVVLLGVSLIRYGWIRWKNRKNI